MVHLAALRAAALPLLCALHAGPADPRGARAAALPTLCAVGAAREHVVTYEDIVIPTPSTGPPAQEITVVDLMPYIHGALESSGLSDGTVTVISRHTTTAITINEWEQRLARDLRTWLLQLAPPDDRSTIGSKGAGIRYEHNDIDERPESEDERQRACPALYV